MRIKAFVEALIAIGSEVSEQEHIEIILKGLPNGYDAFSTVLHTRKETYSVSEFESLLLVQEIRIDRDNSKTVVTEPLSANLENTNSKDKNSNTEKLPGNSCGAQMYGQNSRGNFQTRGRGKGGFFKGGGRGRNFAGRRNYITCQVCHKAGHIAFHCFHRFDHSFQSTYPTHQGYQQHNYHSSSGNIGSGNMTTLLTSLDYAYDTC